MSTAAGSQYRVVIVGAGFGGLFAAKRLGRLNASVTIIDRASHHLFQPLLYQVATGILSAGEIAPAVREVLKRQKNTRVLRGEVSAIDLTLRTVTSLSALGETVTPYDSLIVAVGNRTSYFGHDEFAMVALNLTRPCWPESGASYRARPSVVLSRSESRSDWRRRCSALTLEGWRSRRPPARDPGSSRRASCGLPE